MTYLAKRLKHRIKILKAVDTPNNDGGLTRSYTTLIRLWSKKKPISQYIRAVRHVNTNDNDTDEFTVRYSSVISKFNLDADYDESKGMGRSFTIGFTNGFDSLIDLNPVKSEYFIFMEGATTTRGRLFKINAVARDDEHKEFILLRCTEIEEQGTGAIE